MGLRALRKALDKGDEKTIPTEESLKITEFVLKNNYFEYGKKIKQQISETATETKFALPYACISMSDGYGISTFFISSSEPY